ncbi:MAG: DUF308 domain-containing protein [Clostridia bacterium]|nr:DUF308 domain-containing protein [Clostridia bacterium]
MKNWFHSYGERGWIAVCTFLAMLVFGLMLLIHPENIYNLLLNLAGGVLILIGLIRVVSYFFSDAMMALEGRKLSGGVVTMMAGLALILFKPLFISLIPLLLGAVMFVGGAIRLQGALDLKRLGGDRYKLVLGSSVVSLVLGLIIVLNPFQSGMTLLRLIGASLLLETIMDGVYTWKFHKWLDDIHRRFH